MTNTADRSNAIARPLLAIESSGGALSVAIAAPDARILAQVTEVMMRGHAERIMPMIAEVLVKAGLSALDLGAVAATVGPGSFTGIRVGLAAARGIGIAATIPVIGIGSAAAVANAQLSAAEGRPQLVLIDSRRADLFIQAFDAEGQSLGDAVAVPPEDLQAFVANLAGEGLFVTGDAAETHAEALEMPNVTLVPCGPPPASAVAALARRALADPASLPTPAPVYIRPPDAAVPAFGGRLKRLLP